MFCACVLLGAISCAKDPLRVRPPSSFAPYTFAVDQWPTFSPAGDMVAYHRVLASTDGPPGVYVVPVGGGQAKLVVQSDFTWPRHLRFSPDGSKLICDWGQLSVIDIATGTVTSPFFTDNRIYSPSWSSDGTRIAYARVLRAYDEPADSGGTHVYSLVSYSDHVVQASGVVLNSSWPQWSSDETFFAYISNHPSGKTALYVMTPDSVHQAVSISSGWWFERFQWIRRNNDDLLLIQERTLSGDYRGFFTTTDGRMLGSWPIPMGFYDVASADGQRAVLVRGQLQDSIGVLFYQDMAGRHAPRQLTTWRPADS